MFRTISRASLLLVIVASLSILQSCSTTTCDNIPTETATVVRLFNCITDVPRVTVFIDNKLYDTALYYTDNLPSPFANRDASFGYHSRFVSGYGQLLGGYHRLVLTRDFLRDAKGNLGGVDTLKDTTIFFSKHRQTLVFMGRIGINNKFARAATRLLYLDDETRSADTGKTLARFVHAVPDLAKLDVYFSRYAKTKPDLVIEYGHVSSNNGSGQGSGVSPNDYVEIPSDSTTNGLLVVEHGDTTNVILQINQQFTSKGFFSTVVVRGESHPVGVDPIVSSYVLQDGSQSYGTFTFEATSFGIRFINAFRSLPLSLLLQGWNDKAPRTNLPQQQYVEFVAPDTISRYMPLVPFYHATATYIFNDAPDMNSIFDPATNIYSTAHDSSRTNQRYSVCAIDTMKLGSAKQGLSHLITTDSVSMPDSPAYGRLRIVNLSPDHVANFTFAGHSYALAQRGIVTLDTLINGSKPYSIPVSDGTASSTMIFALPATRPVTLYLFPATVNQAFPYATSSD